MAPLFPRQNEGSHNPDGINPESCRNVHIVNCRSEAISFGHVQIQAEAGFAVTHAKGIFVLDTTIDVQRGSPLILRDSREVDSTCLRTRTSLKGIPFVDADSTHAR
jgi:hypothetical protein